MQLRVTSLVLTVSAAAWLPALPAIAAPEEPAPARAPRDPSADPSRGSAKAGGTTEPRSEDQAPERTGGIPEGFVEMFVAAVLPTDGGPAVVLRDKAEKVLVPIWIGTSEAHSILLRLERRRFPRPLTHDLLDAMVRDLGGEILKIHVDDLRGDTFVGTVFVKREGRVQHFDARPSDSIALAVGNSAPIFVSNAVIARIAAKRGGGEDDEDEDDAEDQEPEDPPSKPVSVPHGIQTL